MRIRLRSLLRGAAVLLLVTLVLGGVGYLLRVPLFGGLVKAEITSRLAAALGGRYAVDEVGGNWVTSLEVRGLRTLEAPPAGPFLNLGIEQAVVDYDLLTLLGNDALRGVEGLVVKGARVDLDLTRSGSEDPSPPADGLRLPASLRPRVSVDGTLRAETGSGPILARGLALRVGPGVPVEVRVADLELPERFALGGPLAGRVERVDGERYRWTSDARFGGVRVPQAEFDLRGHGSARVEVAGGVIALTRDATLTRAVAEGLDLAAVPDWILGLVPDGVEWPTAGRVAAELEWPHASSSALRLAAYGPRRRARVEAIGVRWRDLEIARLAAEVEQGDAGEPLLQRLDVDGAEVRVRATGVALDLGGPALIRRAGRVEAEVRDVRQLLPAAPAGLVASVVLSAESSQDVLVESALLRRGADRLMLHGRVTLPPEPRRWRAANLDLLLEGTLHDLAPLDVETRGHARLRGMVQGTLEEAVVDLEADGEDWSIEGYALESVLLRGGVSERGIRGLALAAEGPAARVSVAGSFERDTQRLELSAMDVDVDDVARAAARWLPEGPVLSGRLAAEGRLLLEGERLEVDGRVVAEGAEIDGVVLDALDLGVRTDGDRIDADALSLRGPWGQLRAAVTVHPRLREATVQGLVFSGSDHEAALREPMQVRWSAGKIEVPLLRALVDDRLLTAAFAYETGRRRFTVPHLSVSRLTAERGAPALGLREPLVVQWDADRVHVPLLAARYGDVDLRGSFDIDPRTERATVQALEVVLPSVTGHLLSPLELALRGSVVDLERLRFEVDGHEVEVAAEVDLEASRARLARLRAVVGEHEVRAEAPIAIAWDPDGVSAEGLAVRVRGALLTGRAAWRGDLVADLALDDLDLATWVGSVSGIARGRLRVDGDVLLADVEVPRLGFGAWAGHARVGVRQDAAGPLHVESLALRGPQGGVLNGQAVLGGRLTLEGFEPVEGVVANLAIDGRLGGLDAFGDVVDGPVTLTVRGDPHGLQARVTVANVLLCRDSSLCDDAVLDVRVTPESVVVGAALASMGFAEVKGDVRSSRGFDWTRPETLTDMWEEARIEGDLSLLVRSWPPLAELGAGIERIEGAAGAVLRIRGPLRAPDLAGVVTLDDLTLDLDADIAPFQGLDARLVWRGDEVLIERLEGEMGYAPFSIQGAVRLPDGRLPELDLQIHGRNTQLIRTDWTRLRIDIDGRVHGPLDALVAEGGGRVVEGVLREPVSLGSAGGLGESPEVVLFEIDDAPFDTMRFDLDVKADESLRIRNNLLRTNLSFDGRLEGTGLRPELVGRASFDNADIFLPLSTLRNGQGEVVFVRGSPFRPRVQMTAQTRTKGYELGVQVAGVLPDVNLNVFTEPRLDDEDAVLMLTTGSTSAELADGGIVGKSLASALSVFGGSLFSTRGDGGEPGGKAFFERFEFSTEWDGSSIRNLDGEVELSDRFYLHLQTTRFEETNLGLIWRLRFR